MINQTNSPATVTSIVGGPTAGNTDGVGLAASFFSAYSVTYAPVGLSGSLYITEQDRNCDVRLLDLATVAVSTVAGTPYTRTVDGVGTAATFAGIDSGSHFGGLARLTDGSLAYADDQMRTIRLIAVNGTVTTLAGGETRQNYFSSNQGSADGVGTDASFQSPQSVVVDLSGNLLVCDNENNAMRTVAPDGTVSTLTLLNGASSGCGGILVVGTDVFSFFGPWLYSLNTSTGVQTQLLGLSPVPPASFSAIISAAADSAGTIVLAVGSPGQDSSLVYTVAPPYTTATLLAGTSTSCSVNGVGTGATFSQPKGCVPLDCSYHPSLASI